MLPRSLPILHLSLGALLTLAGCGSEPAGREADQPPDVVIFLIDTLRADWTQIAGFDRETTPHMIALAEESVVFEQAHSAGPWTLPSVVSLFTGRHLVEHNVVHDNVKLPESAVTLAECLGEWGYDTVSFHRNVYAGETWGAAQGFRIAQHVKRKEYEPAVGGFLGNLAARPFFLYAHIVEPHDPQKSRPEYLEAFEPVEDTFLERYAQLVSNYRRLTRMDFVRNRELGTTDNSDEQAKLMGMLTEVRGEVHNIYSASVLDADARIGAMIARLKEAGRWDDTLFIVLSDHGEEMDDHGGWQHDQSVYQELIHVPLIVRFPGGEYGGRRVETPVSLVDVLPTVLEVTGCPADVETSGRSLVPLAAGHRPEPEARVVGMRNNQKKYYRPFKEQRGDVNVAVRKGDWKAIYNIELDTLELYDLATDPGEQTDLAESRPEVADELRRFAARRYHEMLASSARAANGGLSASDAATLEALEDLGYVGGDEEEDEDG